MKIKNKNQINKYRDIVFKVVQQFAYIHKEICNIPIMITNTMIHSDKNVTVKPWETLSHFSPPVPSNVALPIEYIEPLFLIEIVEPYGTYTIFKRYLNMYYKIEIKTNFVSSFILML